MDAVKFIEERNRMCRHFDNGCYECPASNTTCENELLYCAVGQESTMDAKAQIAIVEEWSKEHPRKTRQDAFLEQWPEAVVTDGGVLSLCPAALSSSHRKQNGRCGSPSASCDDCCREFWMQEVDNG